MPFPQSDRVIFERNPLEQVICQLRFPTILQIAARDPAGFQDRVRAQYPGFSRNEAVQAAVPEEIAQLLGRFGMQLPGPNASYTFKSADGHRQIGLTQEFVSVTDRHYVHWENFFAEVERARTALEAEYQPGFYTRIGLRYVDVIDRAELELQDVPWHELVNRQLLDALGSDEIGGQVTEIKTDALLIVPEVPNATLRLRHGLVKTGKERYLFDADFYVDERKNSGDVAQILVRFHELAGHLWRWAIAPTLREALKPMEVGG